MDALQINDQLIAYRHRPGLGRTIVFANSLGSDQSIWDDVIACLPGGYGVLTYDLRGHGQSGHTSCFGLEDLADDVDGLVRFLGLQDVLFCGVSIGGLIGQVLAARAPDYLSRAVLCNTAPVVGTQARWDERISAVESGGISAIAETIISNWFGEAYADASPHRLRMHLHMLSRVSSSGYVDACRAIAATDLSKAVKQISIPILCVGGDEDKSVPAGDVRALADAITDAKLEILPGVGHFPCLEAPAKLAQLIEGFDQSDWSAQARGMSVRRAVLGHAHVDRSEAKKTSFDAAFQKLITEGAWGTVWHSPGVSARERSMLTLALLAAQGNFEEIPMHVRATARTGATERDIGEAMQHVAIYAGVPRANNALKLIKATLSEMKAQQDE
ncbi:MAG: 4-carboxymuconolactone decarboxylase [Pseudomonadota bacterium]